MLEKWKWIKKNLIFKISQYNTFLLVLMNFSFSLKRGYKVISFVFWLEYKIKEGNIILPFFFQMISKKMKILFKHSNPLIFILYQWFSTNYKILSSKKDFFLHTFIINQNSWINKLIDFDILKKKGRKEKERICG